MAGSGAHLLDISRLVSRAGLVATGVDRVEIAYLARLIADPVPCFGLARTALGFVLLDRPGLAQFHSAVTTGVFGRADIISRLSWRLSGPARLGQTLARKLAIARGRPHRLKRMLARIGPNSTYFNVGHSNLSDRVCRAVKQAPNVRIRILLHDTIPLDWPDLQRTGTVADFARKFSVAARYADQIICTSAACAADVGQHLQGAARQPPIIVAHLGVKIAIPDMAAVPAELMFDRPCFVMVGTIEPRKNHAMILDIWDKWGADAPSLILCGARGWRNGAVFARLDAGVLQVREAPHLNDAAVAALLVGSHGLLFPSIAEGFGLPPIEAAALGVPVVCADLPACREILSEHTKFLSPSDSASWEKAIKSLADMPLRPYINTVTSPTWDDHFKVVLSS